MMFGNRFFKNLCMGTLFFSLLFSPLTVFATSSEVTSNDVITTTSETTPYDQPVQSNDWENWPKGPSIHAEAAIVMEADTGTILYAKDIEEKQYPASITKILTTLVVLENSQLNEEITYSYHATHSIDPGSSSIARTEGEILTVEESLYGLMLASANECANALAEHVAGSSEAFAELMNAKAKELGCVNSNFVNAHGLHNPEHYTCPYDMALITRAAIQNEDFRRIAGSNYFTLRATNKNEETLFMQNHHNMIAPYKTDKFLDDTIFSGKTGFTTDALHTLVTCGTRNGMEVVVVSMRTQATEEQGVPLYTDTAALLDYANNFQKLNIAEHEQTFVIGNAYDFSIDADDLKTSGSLISIDKSSTVILPNTLSFSNARPSISFEESDEGKQAFLTYEYAGQCIGKASITLEERTEQDFHFSETESGEDISENGPKFITINLKVVFLVFGILLLILFAIQVLKSFIQKNRAKIRKTIHIYQKRHFLRRRRPHKRRRR